MPARVFLICVTARWCTRWLAALRTPQRPRRGDVTTLVSVVPGAGKPLVRIPSSARLPFGSEGNRFNGVDGFPEPGSRARQLHSRAP
jgi:hypothetical protein